MSIAGGVLATTRVRHDSFELRPAAPSAPALRYQRIAAPADAAAESFSSRLGAATSSTDPSKLAATCAAYARVLQRNIAVLTRTAWPAAAKPLVAELVDRVHALIGALSALPKAGSSNLSAGKQRIERASIAVSLSGARLRSLLFVPNFGRP